MKNTKINIRAFTINDLDAITELDKKAFQECYPKFFLRQAFDVFGELFKVAETHDNKIAGYILGALQPHNTEAWILSVIVDENYRRQKIAEQLINRLLTSFQQHNLTQVLLTVDPLNVGAITLYQKMGFTELYREGNYFGNHEEKIVMVKKLNSRSHIV